MRSCAPNSFDSAPAVAVISTPLVQTRGSRWSSLGEQLSADNTDRAAHVYPCRSPSRGPYRRVTCGVLHMARMYQTKMRAATPQMYVNDYPHPAAAAIPQPPPSLVTALNLVAPSLHDDGIDPNMVRHERHECRTTWRMSGRSRSRSGLRQWLSSNFTNTPGVTQRTALLRLLKLGPRRARAMGPEGQGTRAHACVREYISYDQQ